LKINRLSPDIYEIEDFVTLEQQKEILNFCNSLEEDQWWEILSEQDKLEFWYGKQYRGEKPQVFEDIDNNIKNLYASSEYIPGAALQRCLDHEPMQQHRDYWLKDLDHYIRYGIVIYYNDDYLGGEIEYPELDIVYKPKARSLVMHGGNILHGPKKVIGDKVRYFSTDFIRGSVENPVVLNPELFADVELHDGSNYP
jgi:hypothetical protein